MYEETVLINELMDGYPDINIVGAMAIELGEPLVADEVEERIVVPRNSNYYEETIPQYMGDLLVDHFRMSRGAFEQLTKIMQNTGLLPRDITIPVEKRLLFTIWVLAKPESFLAVGDRFGFAKSKANGVYMRSSNGLRRHINSDIYPRFTSVSEPLLNENQHIIGDSAYPLMKNVMTPFRDNGHLTAEELNYNFKLSSIRSVIERSFGRLKGKFRRLKYLDVDSPEFASHMIAAACVIHNFIRLNNENDVEDNYFDVNDNDHVVVEPCQEDNRNIANQKRRNIVDILNH
ncbi:hypothetical protein MML48_4g00000652 [Holotrichia oblita]|uniref:Uncharacterized protein n=1 Tax=Holotrichia oblita TaxID=644536 RepID=A0ACB9T8C4_HOLOL|nr:hypothetical protein MML48_4g00000652 [Holotrichia oblita]